MPPFILKCLLFVPVGVVIVWFSNRIGSTACVGIAIRVGSLDGNHGIGIFRGVRIPVVHLEVGILLAIETIAVGHRILVMVAYCKGILTGSLLQTGHLCLHAIFYCVYLPLGIGIEYVGHYNALTGSERPVGSIALAVEVGIGTEHAHLFIFIPVSTLVVTVGNGGTAHGVHIISIGHAVDINVRLPYITAGGSMTAFVHLLAIEGYLVIHSKVGMAAEEAIVSKLTQQV